MCKTVLVVSSWLLVACVNKHETILKSGDVEDGSSGSVSYIANQVIVEHAETDAAPILERVILKQSSASAWMFGDRPLTDKLWESVGGNLFNAPGIPDKYDDEYQEESRLFKLTLRSEASASQITNPIVTFYIRNTGSKSMTVYNLLSFPKALLLGRSSLPFMMSFKGRKLEFSHKHPYTLIFDKPISISAGKTFGIEIELGLETIDYYYSRNIHEVRLEFHNGTKQVTVPLCYFEFDNGKRGPESIY